MQWAARQGAALLPERAMRSAVLVGSRDLRLHRPLRGMVILVRLVFLETLVDLAGLVMRRCVDGVELHPLLADVRHVVPSARGHEDASTVEDLLVEGELILCRAHLHAATAPK